MQVSIQQETSHLHQLLAEGTSAKRQRDEGLQRLTLRQGRLAETVEKLFKAQAAPAMQTETTDSSAPDEHGLDELDQQLDLLLK